MTLQEQVNAGITDAMRARDQTALATLRLLKTALTVKEVERGRALDAAEALQVVTSLVKQRRESIAQFTAGGRQDLADKEAAEIVVLERFLPPAMTPDEIARVVDETATELEASSAKDFGRVMKSVMAKLTGRAADGKVVSEAVKRRLG